MKWYLIDHYINTLKLSSFNVVVKSQPHWAATVDGSMTLPPHCKWIWSLYNNMNAYYQRIWALMTTWKKSAPVRAYSIYSTPTVWFKSYTFGLLTNCEVFRSTVLSGKTAEQFSDHCGFRILKAANSFLSFLLSFFQVCQGVKVGSKLSR